MKRNELTGNLFQYVIISVALIWALFCLFCPLVRPDTLSTEDCKKYQAIATDYYETGEYQCEESIVVTNNSKNCISVVDSNRPFSASLTFYFTDDTVKVKDGINLYFLNLIVPSLLVAAIAVVFIFIICRIIFPYKEEGC